VKDLESTSDLEIGKRIVARCIEISKRITREVRTIKSENEERKGMPPFWRQSLFLGFEGIVFQFFYVIL